MVVERRMFISSEHDNKFTTVTKSFVLFGSIAVVIIYGKAMSANSESWALFAIFLTFIIWFYNFVNNSKFDSNTLNGSLGGDV